MKRVAFIGCTIELPFGRKPTLPDAILKFKYLSCARPVRQIQPAFIIFPAATARSTKIFEALSYQNADQKLPSPLGSHPGTGCGVLEGVMLKEAKISQSDLRMLRITIAAESVRSLNSQDALRRWKTGPTILSGCS